MKYVVLCTLYISSIRVLRSQVAVRNREACHNAVHVHESLRQQVRKLTAQREVYSCMHARSTTVLTTYLPIDENTDNGS